MVSTNHASVPAQCAVVAAGRYQFISIRAPDDAKDPTTRRLARSHAVKQALESKRKLQQQSGDNFRTMIPKDETRRSGRQKKHTRTLAESPFSLSTGALDPFHTLPVDSSRLQALLGDYKARQAPEPVFSVAKELAFQNFHSVFRTGLVDPALLNTIMLSLVLAVAGGSMNQEGLEYQGQAISHIRRNMSSLNEATSESTIGAILLLAGVEARLGMTSQVQLHMGAIHRLLKICRTKGVCLTSGIKRAIFWQDLNSSVLAGSTRVVDHTTFSELQWTRAPFSPTFFQLPLGFQSRYYLLTDDFVELLEDIQALQCIRDISPFTRGDVMLMANINNHIASVQSRLASLPNLSPVLECCRLAAYMCSVMLCCTVWCALVIPSHISSRLLWELQHANENPIWDDHPELLLWLLYIGGAFAPIGTVRSDYLALLRSNNAARFRDLCRSWPELLGILKQFTWSDKAFTSQAKAFWEESLA